MPVDHECLQAIPIDCQCVRDSGDDDDDDDDLLQAEEVEDAEQMAEEGLASAGKGLKPPSLDSEQQPAGRLKLPCDAHCLHPETSLYWL